MEINEEEMERRLRLEGGIVLPWFMKRMSLLIISLIIAAGAIILSERVGYGETKSQYDAITRWIYGLGG